MVRRLSRSARRATSTLSFPLGDNRANGGTIALRHGHPVGHRLGEAGTSAATHFIFDMTDYFVP